jgi:hypothetical protein
LNNAFIVIEDSLIKGGSTTTYGAGMYLQRGSSLTSSATVRSSRFVDNFCGSNGCGIYAETATSLFIYDSYFMNNTGLATGALGEKFNRNFADFWEGGAVYMDNVAHLVVRNTSFYANGGKNHFQN